jgi:hypothetical protein
VYTKFARSSCQTTCTTPSESVTIAGFVATPEWERFTGGVHGSSDWALASEGVTDAMNRALASNNLASLNIHATCSNLNLVNIEYY